MKINKTKIIYGLIFVFFLTLILPHFLHNILWLLGGGSLKYIMTGRWDLVFLNILFFSIFLMFLILPSKKGSWRTSSSIYIAFIISLFFEMFGFPLTIYLFSSFISHSEMSTRPSIAFNLNFFGTTFAVDTASLIAGIMSVLGGILIILGWKEIYGAKNTLVTSGIYKHIRHPQYLGILMISFVWLIAWPSILTLVMWPILLFQYLRLARAEDREMEDKFGKTYLDYKRRTPMFLPFL